jgi:hypothetical protein
LRNFEKLKNQQKKIPQNSHPILRTSAIFKLDTIKKRKISAVITISTTENSRRSL